MIWNPHVFVISVEKGYRSRKKEHQSGRKFSRDVKHHFPPIGNGAMEDKMERASERARERARALGRVFSMTRQHILHAWLIG